jgi:nucleotide-binding universal stress UspA family protein
MFQHILVPLDGSRMAEAALPVALYLSHSFGSQVTLFHVIERDAPKEIHGERHLHDPQVAENYLRECSAPFEEAGIIVATHVHEAPQDNVARSIAEHGEEFGVDLIAMCTHGKGGLRAFLFGRIAQQVAAVSATPVLFVQPLESELSDKISFNRVLVPLDGDVDHEEGLFVAESFVEKLNAELYLVMVVPEVANLPGEEAAAARLSPLVASELLDIVQNEAVEYLDRHVKRLQCEGIPVEAAVFRGDPVAVISAAVDKGHIDAVVLGTHGKTGLGAFWARSATPQLSHKIRIPFLLVPVHGEGAGNDDIS